MKNKETLKIVLDSMREFKIIGTAKDEVIAEKIIDTIYNNLINHSKTLELEIKESDTLYNIVLSKGMKQINDIITEKLT